MANQGGSLVPLSWQYRIRCSWLDLTSHPLLIWISALLRYAAGTLARPFFPALCLHILSRAHVVIQRAWGPARTVRWLNHRIAKALARVCQQSSLPERESALPTAGACQDARHAGIILKAPRLEDGNVAERGVLLLKYTHRIDAFRRCADMEALLQHYQLVLEPSWTGYASPEFLAFTRYGNHIIVMLSPFEGDRELLGTLGSNLIPIELGSGDWVDPRVFRPLEGEPKRYDAVMIARWSYIKRHDLLLRALRQIGDPTFRLGLVAANVPEDSDREGILAAIEKFGLRHQIDVFEDIEPEEVNRVLNRSKVNVLLSRQEGGNRGLFEGFFSGVPGLAFRNHIGVRTEHFQPQTGRLCTRVDLARELVYFREHWSEFDPRSWALRHITPEISSRRLNEFLKQEASRRGEVWTSDILMKCNRPDLEYYPDNGVGRGMPTMDDLLRQFPLATSS